MPRQLVGESHVPVRVIYLSDFDPGGQNMPKTVARKVEFTIARFGLDVDVQLIPLALSAEQCRRYKLPRTPIKETERRKDAFEKKHGEGATELDALADCGSPDGDAGETPRLAASGRGGGGEAARA